MWIEISDTASGLMPSDIIFKTLSDMFHGEIDPDEVLAVGGSCGENDHLRVGFLTPDARFDLGRF